MNLLKTILIMLAILPFVVELLCVIKIKNFRLATIDIGKTTNETLRALRLRYINATKLGIPVMNSSAYIHKTLLGRNAPLSRIINMDSFTCYLASLNFAIASILVWKMYYKFSFMFGLSTLSFLAFRQCCAIRIKVDNTVYLAMDYLENVLSHKLKGSAEKRSRMESNKTDSCIETEKNENHNQVERTHKKAEPVVQAPPNNLIQTSKSTLFVKDASAFLQENNPDIVDAILQEYFT